MIRDKYESKTVQKTLEQKDLIVDRLKHNGYRITKQRLLIMDTILDNECSCCKEIYYQVITKDPKVGIATVYRMVKTLEEIGAIDRKNLYRISYEAVCDLKETCIVYFKNQESIQLSGKDWAMVLEEGLKAGGYLKNQKIDSIVIQSCNCI